MLITAVTVTALWFSASNSLQRIDNLVYDFLLVTADHAQRDDILVLAIDDDSLQRIGRWPWSRRIHAEVLDRLTGAGARAVGFDILFPEPQLDDPGADRAFAEALHRNGRTVLAVAPSNPSDGDELTEVLPLPALAEGAAALGHVDIEIDADGLCRSFYAYGGLGTPHWPAFGLALLKVGGGSANIDVRIDAGRSGSGWVRAGRFRVPFDARPSAVDSLSVASFLSDPGLDDRVADRYVLVGSTATGLGDMVSTPVSYDHRRMPGVVLNAQILSGLLDDRIARDIGDVVQVVLTLAFATAGALSLVLFSIPWAALLVPLVTVSAVLSSAWLLSAWQLWFAPGAAIAPLLIAFPLWSIGCLLQEKAHNRALTLRMQREAMYHAATGLPNEQRLEQRLRELGEAPHDTLAALMIVHVARAGAAAGLLGGPGQDTLLKSVAERLDRAVRNDDLVVHLSGDDFALLVSDLESHQSALDIAAQLLEVIRKPLSVDQLTVLLVPRLGVSLWPTEGRDTTALLRNAHMALFRARVEETTGPCVYSEQIAREVEAHSQLERALLSALERGEFEVYYQPQVGSTDNCCHGVEALLRWHNPDLGMVFPATFIPVAEHNGLIREIGAWVLSTACQQVQAWNAAGLGPLRLAVNLSPLQIADMTIVGDVERALKTSGLKPSELELEVTESAVIQNFKQARETMDLLKSFGVKLAIDDFGTGYSALSYLQQFPFDRIKIDRSFTGGMHDHPDVMEITLTIIGMAKRLRRGIIAEGVENRSQAEFLQKHGCDELQGFLFSYPLPADEMVRFLNRDTGSGPSVGVRE